MYISIHKNDTDFVIGSKTRYTYKGLVKLMLCICHVFVIKDKLQTEPHCARIYVHSNIQTR